MSDFTDLALNIHQSGPDEYSWVILQSVDEPGVFEHFALRSPENYDTAADAINAGCGAMHAMAREEVKLERVTSGKIRRGYKARAVPA